MGGAFIELVAGWPGREKRALRRHWLSPAIPVGRVRSLTGLRRRKGFLYCENVKKDLCVIFKRLDRSLVVELGTSDAECCLLV